MFDESNRPNGVPANAVVGRELAEITKRDIGKGKVILVPIFAGLAYSAKVRRGDFDMHTDFDPAIRAMIASEQCSRVVPHDPLVEAVYLQSDHGRSVALMNWSYRSPHELVPIENLRIDLPADVQSVQSIMHGPLKLENHSVTLPKISEVDLLVLQ
jgi:hypothetical protein